MKKFLCVCSAIVLCGMFSMNAKKMHRPEWLKPGDKIAIISPASVPDTSYVNGGMEILREWGYVPVLSKYAMEKNGTFAGTAENRRDDLLWALSDPSIKAIMSSRGGYGSIKELELIDSNTLGRNPKWLIGYSDITAVHSALVMSGVMSIHAHMLEHLDRSKGKDSCSVVLRDMLQGKLPKYKVSAHKYNQYGEATGMLVGGNMSVFGGMAGSSKDFLTSKDGLILFVEDVDERIESVDRMMNLLRVRGVLDRLKGMVVGKFTGYKPSEDYETMYDMIHEMMREYNIPVVYDFPVGHVSNNMPMIEGAKVRLVVNIDGATLSYE